MHTHCCVDLRERFPQFKIALDPAAQSKHGPWMFQLPCRFGTIYPHGGDQLAVEVDGHPGLARRLAALGLHLHQDGDGEKTFLFPVGRFAEVAAIVKPIRRRHLKPEHRLRLVEAGRGTRFTTA
jgi:hypothetical protein